MFPDMDKLRLGVDNRRLTALLVAILERVGPVTLTREEAARVHDQRTLQSKEHPDGSLTLALDGQSSEPALDGEPSEPRKEA